jgi:hypothetical protein
VPQTLLSVHWEYGDEYVPIPAQDTTEHRVTTIERWRSFGISVTYSARLEHFRTGPKTNSLVLRYAREDQTDPRTLDPNNEVGWGTSEITWQSQAETATARWTDDAGPAWNGTVKVNVLGEEAPVNQFRRAVSVIVRSRPGQQALRDQLFCLDKHCAISGEQEAAAIETAHIVPVKAGGQEVISNALLLRADIHRLFDAGLFWFELSADHAHIKHVVGLSQMYRDLLTGRSLPELTLRRVEKALRLRSKLPGGNGPPVES